MESSHFVKFLIDHGIQPTSQRVGIARLVLSRPQHLSAERIISDIRANGLRISKATVYNTLNLFCERGLLRTVDVDPARLYYDSTIEPHHHFYNVDTGELTDIPFNAVQFRLDADLPDGTEQTGVEVVIRVRSAEAAA